MRQGVAVRAVELLSPAGPLPRYNRAGFGPGITPVLAGGGKGVGAMNLFERLSWKYLDDWLCELFRKVRF